MVPAEYPLFPAGQSASSKLELKALASDYGVAFPDEYLAHATSRWGGLYLEVRADFWPRQKAGDIGP